jgi:short-subunit dehydrogenase
MTNKDMVIIVGAGPGVSGAVATAFAKNGYPIMLIARNEKNLESIASPLRDMGVSVTIHSGDASVPGDIARIISQVTVPISALVYNAAGIGGPLLKASDEEIRSASEVNLNSLVSSTAAALPGLKAADGVVLVTGGGFSLYPSSEFGVLSVGKAMTRSAALLLRQELAPEGIRVHTVTIAGVVDPATDFSPTKIADVFTRLFEDADGPAEVVFEG